jgi:hypothetical protein
MADRTLVAYTEPEESGPFPATLRIDRSAAGSPGLFVTVQNALEEQSTVILPDGLAVLAPVLAWLLEDPNVYSRYGFYAQAAQVHHERSKDPVPWEDLLPSQKAYRTLKLQEYVESMLAVGQMRQDQVNGTLQVGPKA